MEHPKLLNCFNRKVNVFPKGQWAFTCVKWGFVLVGSSIIPLRPRAVVLMPYWFTIWCSDITYIWTTEGFVYLASIMDLFSRKIIAWNLSRKLDASGIIRTLQTAKQTRNPGRLVVIHTDRGCQYLSQSYIKETAQMCRSYSKKGYPWDNACIESFHALIKREWLNRFKIENYQQAYMLVFEYINTFYNTVRIHSHCNYMSPNDYEKLYANYKKKAALIAG